MVTFKCGTCNMTFNVEEQYIIEKDGYQVCPNCNHQIEYDLVKSVKLVIKRNSEFSSKAYIIPNSLTTNEGTLTFLQV